MEVGRTGNIRGIKKRFIGYTYEYEYYDILPFGVHQYYFWGSEWSLFKPKGNLV